MVAYFEIQRNAGETKRILEVANVAGPAEAATILKRIKAVHADRARLLSLEDYSLHYTVHEIMTERNLLGGARRYSTGTRTVTIPEKE